MPWDHGKSLLLLFHKLFHSMKNGSQIVCTSLKFPHTHTHKRKICWKCWVHKHHQHRDGDGDGEHTQSFRVFFFVSITFKRKGDDKTKLKRIWEIENCACAITKQNVCVTQLLVGLQFTVCIKTITMKRERESLKKLKTIQIQNENEFCMTKSWQKETVWNYWDM